jgi:hypothetical protein
MEIREIIGYEGLYGVDYNGIVYTRHTGEYTVLKSYTKGWYRSLKLCKNGVQRSHKIHRLVAQAFIPNPENKRCVNHKNFDKTDNRVENLEWCTHQENINYTIKNNRGNHVYGAKHPHSKIIVNTENGIFYECIREAANSLGLSRDYVKNRIRKHRIQFQYC